MHIVFRVVLLSLLMPACRGVRPGPDTPVSSITELDSSFDGSGALRVPAGTKLPVRIDLDVPFAQVTDARPVVLEFTRDVYWWPRSPEWISFDGKAWFRVTDRFAGTLNFGVERVRNRAPEAKVFVGLTPRGS